MKMSMYAKAMAVVGISLAVTSSAFADFEDIWNWFKGPRKTINTIIITSNYTQSRLMADLIQNGSRQPYVLLPAEGQKNIYFCPVNPNQPALQLTEKNVGRFINFANPDKVIAVGGPAYVPQRYLDQIDKRIPVVVVPVKDWNLASRAIGEMMDLPNLESDYQRLDRKIKLGFYRPMNQDSVKNNPPADAIPSSVEDDFYDTPAKEPVKEDPMTKIVVVKETEVKATPEVKEPAVTPKAETKAETPAK